ncbi:MAG: succinate dehydrogenase/fumarate reductase iron-sulfur subunit [Candidatus Micrarchaeia archaeon]
MEVYLKVLRSNGKKSWLQTFRLNLHENATVLDALREAKEKLAPSLAFRASCRSRICGACAVRINGVARLACGTKIGEVARKGVIRVEPLRGARVIKDLVIDESDFWKKIAAVEPWMAWKGGRMSRAELERIGSAADCIKCWACMSECDVACEDRGFLGPAPAAVAWRFVADKRDGRKRERLEDAVRLGLWKCAHAYACSEVCPKKVDPLEAIAKLREEALRHGLTASDGARHVLAFVELVRKSGRLDEALLIPLTLGVKSMREIPMALRLLKKGKLPFPRVRAIRDAESARRMLEGNGGGR